MVLEIQVEIQNSLTSNLFMMKRDYCITDQRQCIRIYQKFLEYQ